MRSASTVPGSAPRAVFAQLADGRPLTVADLTAHTGLPRSTVVDALRRLADAGQVEQRGPGRQGRGRPSPSWSIAELLADRLGCPVHSENDANLAALGEAVLGAGAGLDTVLHVSPAHGTGAGLVIDGRLHRGRSGLAGEIGHLHADDDGRLCHCGARGCFWHSRSIPALLAALAEAHGRPFTLADVARAADEDDHDVVRALLGFGYALGRRLADAVVYIDPDAIVIEGSLSGTSG